MAKYTLIPMNTFETIVVGEQVVVQDGGAMGGMRILKVERITKTQLVCRNKWDRIEKYQIKSGKEVGAEQGRFGWIHHSYLRGKAVKNG